MLMTMMRTMRRRSIIKPPAMARSIHILTHKALSSMTMMRRIVMRNRIRRPRGRSGWVSFDRTNTVLVQFCFCYAFLSLFLIFDENCTISIPMSDIRHSMHSSSSALFAFLILSLHSRLVHVSLVFEYHSSIQLIRATFKDSKRASYTPLDVARPDRVPKSSKQQP